MSRADEDQSSEHALEELDKAYKALTDLEKVITEAEGRETRMKSGSGYTEADLNKFPILRTRAQR